MSSTKDQRPKKLADVLKITPEGLASGQIGPRLDWKKYLHNPRSYDEYCLAVRSLGHQPISKDRFDDLMENGTHTEGKL